MAAALKYVEEHPGCTKMAVAAHIRDKSSNETLRDAYAVVDRLVRNHLVAARFDGTRYSLVAVNESDLSRGRGPRAVANGWFYSTGLIAGNGPTLDCYEELRRYNQDEPPLDLDSND